MQQDNFSSILTSDIVEPVLIKYHVMKTFGGVNLNKDERE
jgi:hypothetical protein